MCDVYGIRKWPCMLSPETFRLVKEPHSLAYIIEECSHGSDCYAACLGYVKSYLGAPCFFLHAGLPVDPFHEIRPVTPTRAGSVGVLDISVCSRSCSVVFLKYLVLVARGVDFILCQIRVSSYNA